MKGFSERNLKYMRKFAAEYPEFEFVQQVVAQLSWSHNLVLIDRVSDIDERMWYMNKCVENKWSRNVLVHQIESDLHHRQKITEKTSNFGKALEHPNNEMAIEVLKDPYIFDFITLKNQ